MLPKHVREVSSEIKKHDKLVRISFSIIFSCGFFSGEKIRYQISKGKIFAEKQCVFL